MRGLFAVPIFFIAAATYGATPKEAAELTGKATQLYVESRYSEAEPAFRRALDAWTSLGPQEKHNRALEPHRFEVLAVHIDPGLRVLWRLEKLLNRLFDPFGAVGVVGLDCDAVQRVTQAI